MTRIVLLAAASAAVCVLAAPGAERIAKVEAGLCPRLRIEGQAPVRWPIGERQKSHNVPGVSVAVIDGDEIAWAKGYGDGVTPETRFQAASISKPVAAVVALRMVARGELSLDEDVNRKLKSWQVPQNEWGKPVTLRQLLSHTGGLTVHGFPGYARTSPLPTLVQILRGEKPANTAAVVCNAEPGSIHRYSGGGYQVLQLLIEDVTGKPFAATVKSLVLDPAGMKNSGYEQPHAKKAAAGHNGKGEAVTGGWHVYPEQAAAGLWTTPTDLARFLLAVKSSKLLPPGLTKEMLAPVKSGYGLGFGIEGSGDAESFGHGGANNGYRCSARMYRSRGQGVVVMTSGDNGSMLAGEVMRAVAEEYAWPSHKALPFKPAVLSEAQLSALAGDYEGEGLKLQVAATGRSLSVTAFGQVLEFVPETESRFVPLSDGAPALVFAADGVQAGGRNLKKLLATSFQTKAAASGGLRGHWSGNIDLPDRSLGVEIDIDKAENGWIGSITIPDQNASGLPLEGITFADGKASFRIKGPPGQPTFEGTLSEDGKTLAGNFVQGDGTLTFKLNRTGEPKIEAPKKSPPVAKEFVGTWEGAIEVQGQTLRLVLKMSNTAEGAEAVLVSVDQGGAEIGVTSIEQTGPKLALIVKQVGGEYVGEINKDGTELSGTWTQGGNSFPLKLTKSAGA